MSSNPGSLTAASVAAARKATRAGRSKAVKGRGSAARATTAGSKRGKYNASGERVNGIWMASAAQAERYRQLLRMEMAGLIENIVTEKAYPMLVNNQLICTYRADFSYDVIDDRGNLLRHVIEDVKGMVTDVFAIKEKLFRALMPVPLTVIHVRGKARHPETGNSDGAGWMAKHWADRLPDP